MNNYMILLPQTEINDWNDFLIFEIFKGSSYMDEIVLYVKSEKLIIMADLV